MPENDLYATGGVLPMGISTFVNLEESECVLSAADYAELQARYDILKEEYEELKRNVAD